MQNYYKIMNPMHTHFENRQHKSALQRMNINVSRMMENVTVTYCGKE